MGLIEYEDEDTREIIQEKLEDIIYFKTTAGDYLKPSIFFL